MTNKDLLNMAEKIVERGCQRCGYNACGAALEFVNLGTFDKAIKKSRLGHGVLKARFAVLCMNCQAELRSGDLETINRQWYNERKATNE
jgi:hypothetical protein